MSPPVAARISSLHRAGHVQRRRTTPHVSAPGPTPPATGPSSAPGRGGLSRLTRGGGFLRSLLRGLLRLTRCARHQGTVPSVGRPDHSEGLLELERGPGFPTERNIRGRLRRAGAGVVPTWRTKSISATGSAVYAAWMISVTPVTSPQSWKPAQVAACSSGSRTSSVRRTSRRLPWCGSSVSSARESWHSTVFARATGSGSSAVLPWFLLSWRGR